MPRRKKVDHSYESALVCSAVRYAPFMKDGTTLEKLNVVKYVFLRHLSEPRDNSLRLIVEEAVVNHSGVVHPSLPELAEISKDAWPIESIEGCKTFELYWKHCAAYLVTEELVGSNAVEGHEDEVFSGKIFRVYTTSHFLDHLARDTGGHIEPLQHYKLICLNHLIDIAAYAPPEIQVIEADSERDSDGPAPYIT